MPAQPELFEEQPDQQLTADGFIQSVERFTWHGRETRKSELSIGRSLVPSFTNEFWTSRQRAGHSLHEISYRACFKPQLPEFFIGRLTSRGAIVYDPFMGRGTTVIQAALMGRVPRGCDVNPLSQVLTLPRLSPPLLSAIVGRLRQIDLTWEGPLAEELLVFYHPDTLKEICALRHYLLQRVGRGLLDHVDEWIRMVAVNRLTGHSAGFFSVYTLPPNQALSVESQRKINTDRRQVPPRRKVADLIAQKSKSLLADVDESSRERLRLARARGEFEINDAASEFWADRSVDLVVTSPPFLDVVDYATDNWLRCWFLALEAREIEIAVLKRLEEWKRFIDRVFQQLARLLKPGGFVAFEVGEVRGGQVRLEETVVPCGNAAGLRPLGVLINEQAFTKTANIWGVSNNSKGTNTNRIVLFQKGT